MPDYTLILLLLAYWRNINWDQWQDTKFTKNNGTLLQLSVKYHVERAIRFLLYNNVDVNAIGRQNSKSSAENDDDNDDDNGINNKGEECETRPPVVIAANHGYHNIMKQFSKHNR